MSLLLDALTSHMTPDVISTLAGQIGASEEQTQSGVGAAFPLLVGALAHNAGHEGGAASLLGALGSHDGGLLGSLAGAMVDPGHQQTGAGILGHLLGDKQDHAASGVGDASGLSSGQSAQLLTLLAPIAMGVLGQHTSQNGFDVSGLMGFLGGEKAHVERQAPGLLGAFLDQNHDGNVADDALRIGVGLLGNFLKR